MKSLLSFFGIYTETTIPQPATNNKKPTTDQQPATNNKKPTTDNQPLTSAYILSLKNNKNSNINDRKILSNVDNATLREVASALRFRQNSPDPNTPDQLIFFRFIIEISDSDLSLQYVLLENKNIAWTRKEYDLYFNNDKRNLDLYYENPNNERSTEQFKTEFENLEKEGYNEAFLLLKAFLSGCQRPKHDYIIKQILDLSFQLDPNNFKKNKIALAVAKLHGLDLIDLNLVRELDLDGTEIANPDDFVIWISNNKSSTSKETLLLDHLKAHPENEAALKPYFKNIILGEFLNTFESDPHVTLYQHWLDLWKNTTDMIDKLYRISRGCKTRTKYIIPLTMITMDFIEYTDLGIDKTSTPINPDEFVLTKLINIFNDGNIPFEDFKNSFNSGCIRKLKYNFWKLDDNKYRHFTENDCQKIIDNTIKAYGEALTQTNTMRP
jgi:hypothetical protein